MKKKLLACLLTAVMMLSLGACAEEPEMPLPQQTQQEQKAPGAAEDFYGYVNYEMASTGKLPYGQYQLSTLGQLDLLTDQRVNDLIRECASKPQTLGSLEQMIGDLYNQCMDTKQREEDGVSFLFPGVKAVNDAKTVEEYLQGISFLYYEYGSTSFLRPSVELDERDTSHYTVYLHPMNTCHYTRDELLSSDDALTLLARYVKNALVEGLDVKPEEAQERSRKVAELMVDMMQNTLTSEQMRDRSLTYCKFDRKDMSSLFSGVSSKALLEAFGVLGEVHEIVVIDVKQIRRFNDLLTEENLQTLKDYSLLCLLSDYSDLLPGNYSKAKNDKLTTDKSVEKEALDTVKALLTEEVGELYARRYCKQEQITAAEKLEKRLVQSCRELINSSTLSDDGKKKLNKKLDTLIFMTGYNKEYKSPCVILPAEMGVGLIGNAANVFRQRQNQEIEMLNAKPDRRLWKLPCQDVDAVYSHIMNTITVPAAMLDESFFTGDGDGVSDLGQLGATLAHEINHAFDATGYCYDENGIYNEQWLSQEDRERFEALKEKTITAYNGYRIIEVYPVNGEQTLAENMADVGGLECVLHLTKTKEERKTVLEDYARLWATLQTTTYGARQTFTDTHSPAEARVNVAVSCMDAFYEVYDVAQGSRMYLAPEDRIRVW